MWKASFFALTLQLDAARKKDGSIQQRMELQREVDALKVSLEKQVERHCIWTERTAFHALCQAELHTRFLNLSFHA